MFRMVFILASLTLVSGATHCRTANQIAKSMTYDMDTNNDGVLSEAEFSHELMINHDHNGNNCTEAGEFIHQWMKEYHVNHNVALNFFNYLNVDKDNCLRTTDMHSDFTLMDADGDGQIFSGEFIAWFLKAHLDNNPGHVHQHCIGH